MTSRLVMTRTCVRWASSPSCRRTLGFLSNFAIAFSFISVSTGSFGELRRRRSVSADQRSSGRGRSSSAGQLLVALVFAELASHFPVAGSIYQWSKRLSNRTLGWFTGWFYFWAQVVSPSRLSPSSSPFVIDGIHGAMPDGRVPRLPGSDRDHHDVHVRVARRRWSSRPLINAFGVRLLSILNNIGVGDRDPRHVRLRADPAVLRQSPVAVGPVRHGRDAEWRPAATTCRPSCSGMFMALFVVYGFDTAGTFGEETIDAGRQAPRGVLASILISGVVGAVFLLGRDPVDPEHPGARWPRARPVGFPIATTITGRPDRPSSSAGSPSASSTCS